MSIEIGITDGVTNTQFAPLIALSAYYQQKQVLEPLRNVTIWQKKRDFQAFDKLVQVLLSILSGCQTLSEVNSRLRPEIGLAQVWGWKRIADQSTLSRTLDALSLKQIDELRQAVTQIWRQIGQTTQHDWRGYLWLDYDLSPLPCGAQAEASQKGYVGAKKKPQDVNWRELALFVIMKPYGQMSFQAISIQSIASNQQSMLQKML